MGLSNAAKRASDSKKARPDAVIDLKAITGESETLRFREPGAEGYFPGNEARKTVRIECPFATDELVQQICLLASCYVPTEGEKVDAFAALAQLARNDYEVFVYVLSKFFEAFPTAHNFKAAVDEAKNA